MKSITVTGLENIERRLKAIPEEARKAIAPAIQKSADEMAEQARMLVPVHEGNLRDSIRVEEGDRELQVVVRAGGELTTKEVRNGSGVKYDYALGQEFGTYKTPARPFFWPSYRFTKKTNIRRIKTQTTKQIKKAWKNGR